MKTTAILWMTLLTTAIMPSKVVASAVPDAQTGRSTVERNSWSTWKPIYFKGDERAWVGINGDGSTVLEVYVYDEDRKLVGFAVGTRPSVEFWPSEGGFFTVKVYNRGSDYNDYVLRTN
jgi:hypothetical protein